MDDVDHDGEVMWEFDTMLRGYDPTAVDKAVAEATAALESGDPQRIAAARQALNTENFEVLLRGYDRQQVDMLVERLKVLLDGGEPPAEQVSFDFSLRGYDRSQVDALVVQIETALASQDPFKLAAARDQVSSTTLRVTWSGYDRAQVDRYLQRAAQELGGGTT
jgi:DivIVA domain-containing protein